MKYLNLMLFLLIISCTNSNSKYNVVSIENINQANLEFAKSIAHKLLSEQSNGNHHQLSLAEATSKMVEGLDKEKQISSYEYISGKYGNYEDLNFYQLLKPRDGTLYQIYRFKGEFSSKANVEVRATLDGNGKLAGFYIMDWKDSL